MSVERAKNLFTKLKIIPVLVDLFAEEFTMKILRNKCWKINGIANLNMWCGWEGRVAGVLAQCGERNDGELMGGGCNAATTIIARHKHVLKQTAVTHRNHHAHTQSLPTTIARMHATLPAIRSLSPQNKKWKKNGACEHFFFGRICVWRNEMGWGGVGKHKWRIYIRKFIRVAEHTINGNKNRSFVIGCGGAASDFSVRSS